MVVDVDIDWRDEPKDGGDNSERDTGKYQQPFGVTHPRYCSIRDRVTVKRSANHGCRLGGYDALLIRLGGSLLSLTLQQLEGHRKSE